MDNETVTARQIGYTYMINGATFAKRYMDALSDFETWEQKKHASEWILLPQNIGTEHGIDETSLQGELYTIVHNCVFRWKSPTCFGHIPPLWICRYRWRCKDTNYFLKLLPERQNW